MSEEWRWVTVGWCGLALVLSVLRWVLEWRRERAAKRRAREAWLEDLRALKAAQAEAQRREREEIRAGRHPVCERGVGTDG